MTFDRRPADFTGFVHREGNRIVDGTGKPLLLRGMGIGNWMLPEGYMWKLSPIDSARQIEAHLEDLAGPEAAQRFWTGFRAAFFNEDDVRRIAESGFDHIRLPINARLIQDEAGEPIEAGLRMIDDCVEWCRRHQLWLLLDLHGAPGGQTGTNIDDSPRGDPDLFIDPQRYRHLAIKVWELLARRYRHETVVMGYDLLNEPLPNDWQHKYPAELVALYQDMTAAIRAIDPDHLIMYEGSHWATNWSIFDGVWDENSALQFHRYWMPPDRAHIAEYLDARERLGLPIYMGEGGENNLEWLYAAHRLYEAHDIGWNFWPWKKIGTKTSPASIVAPEGWQEIVDYGKGGPRPPREAVQRTLEALVEAMRLENCVWNENVVRAINGDRPAVIPGWAFGYRGAGESHGVREGTALKGLREEDAVSIVPLSGAAGLPTGFHHTDGRDYLPAERMGARLRAGDWLEYEAVTGELAAIAVTDETDEPAPVSVSLSERGFRVTAERETIVARITINNGD